MRGGMRHTKNAPFARFQGKMVHCSICGKQSVRQANYKGEFFKCYDCLLVKNASPVKNEFAAGGSDKSQPEPPPQPPTEKKYTTKAFAEIVEERYAFVIWLYRIKKEVDKTREEEARGVEQREYITLFAIPSFIWKHFGVFLRTPLYTEIATLRGHTGAVRCLTLHENKLYSGGNDNIIRIWNTETHEEIATLEGHTEGVNCLTLHKNNLYSARIPCSSQVPSQIPAEMTCLTLKRFLRNCISACV